METESEMLRLANRSSKHAQNFQIAYYILLPFLQLMRIFIRITQNVTCLKPCVLTIPTKIKDVLPHVLACAI